MTGAAMVSTPTVHTRVPVNAMTRQVLVDSDVVFDLDQHELVKVVHDLLALRRAEPIDKRRADRQVARQLRVRAERPVSALGRHVWRRNYRWMRAAGVPIVQARLILDSSRRLSLHDDLHARAEAAEARQMVPS